ncbi:MAG: tetraacyldisaccharide 4'-kinase [Bacteroidetes bacterium]|jgi:tetraacyldisaccharide 4'-kinase|nr:tetraacyldisaccharide 4'-kinase [Bacteroidota bacterium]
MKPGLIHKLNKAQLLLLPFSLMYGFVVLIRNKLFDWQWLGSRQFEIPVISVGNISVGGTGKTPHVEYIARLFQFNMAVLSRGYGRSTKGFRIVRENDKPENTGDEPLQIKSKFPDITVAVCEQRVIGVERLLSIHNQLQLIMLDDAFQHRYIRPGLSIVLINYHKLIYHDYLLPAGRLREPVKGLKRAHVAVVTKCPVELSPEEKIKIVSRLNRIASMPVFFSTFKYGTAVGVFTSQSLTSITNHHILLVSGIADPAPLKKYLNAEQITELRYPDHHTFTQSDVNHILKTFNNIHNKNKVLITTEKDMQRFKPFESLFTETRDKFFYVPIEVNFLFDDAEKFNKIVVNYVEEHKP